ncbi:ABC transporter substrate-binding protein [Saccharibacillus qingshengii]|uniref:ABC transporter substrate-binding protein n=1 Tax=Saccharibacillus qingshengii TaxID=1763540 RepID=UPI0015563C40|nr:extracellular solute-binding protein [Saccharibacillus qingshengii]
MKSSWIHKISIISLSLVLFVLAGSTAAYAAPKAPSDSAQTLKVVYKNKHLFDENAFNEQFPGVKIQSVYWDGKSSLSGLIAKQSPDVVMLDKAEYKQLAKGTTFTDLGSLIQRDQYDTATIYPGLVDALKSDGKLYGLSPFFSTQSIFYNIDLFKKYGVPLPQDGMSWEEILKLAAKFPTKGSANTRVWGLDYPLDSYAYLLNNVSTSEGLARHDAARSKAAMNTAAWKKAYAMTVNAIKSGTIEGSNENGYDKNSFLMGRSAMWVDFSSTNALRDLTADKSALAKYKPFKVGIAAGPSDSKNPKITRNVTLPAILTIPAASTHKDLAWDFIKFYNSEEYAESKSDKLGDYAPSRMDHGREYDGYSTEAFYKLKPNLDLPDESASGMLFNVQYAKIVNSEVKQALGGKKSLDQSLLAIHTQVQKLLKK